MKLLNTKQILTAIRDARFKYKIGTLNNDIKQSTKPEFWHQKPKQSNQKKQELLKLANTPNYPRPNSKLHPLGQALSKYTNKSSSTFDPSFTKQIKSLAPHWFIKQSDINKQLLLQLAKNQNQPKPLPRPHSKNHPLGIPLNNYINKNSSCFDPIFTTKIKSLAPHWFSNQSEEANKKKQELLKLAKIKKQNRPSYKNHPLGGRLANYINKNHPTFDPSFTKQIKSLRPDWFINKSHVANKKKQQLLKLAKSNHPRPNSKLHPLGNALSSYTNISHSSFDPSFTNKLKAIAPHWFISRSNIANQKKQQLIQLAKSNQPRPKRYTTLGYALSNYITKNALSFDPSFTTKIKAIRPNWFNKKRNT